MEKPHDLFSDEPDDRAHVPPTRWRQERPFDAAEYLEGPPPAYAVTDAYDMAIPQIATKRLRRSDLPVVDPASLDYQQRTTPQLHALWAFALTFDGYRYFGVADGFGRLRDFAASVEREFKETGNLQRLGEIGMYRACLFFEQRMWCKWDKSDGEPSRQDVEYLRQLLEAIRSRVS